MSTVDKHVMLCWVANEEHAMGMRVAEKNRKLRPQSASRAKGEAECMRRLIRGIIICTVKRTWQL